MNRSQLILIAINVAGGIAVLGSYAHGFLTHPVTRGQLWGAVPAGLKPVYTLSMLLATAGYFLFTAYVLTRVPVSDVAIFGRFGYGAFYAIYLAILVPSALWMPLTFAMLETPTAGLWVAIRFVLFAVGLASVLLLLALLGSGMDRSGPLFWLAAAGALAFCFQTAFLDAIVWPHFFR
jgi:hypothetical protein